MTKLSIAIGKRFRELRGDRTLAEAAGKAGVAAATWQRTEAGNMPSLETLLAVHRSENAALNWLVFGRK